MKNENQQLLPNITLVKNKNEHPNKRKQGLLITKLPNICIYISAHPTNTHIHILYTYIMRITIQFFFVSCIKERYMKKNKIKKREQKITNENYIVSLRNQYLYKVVHIHTNIIDS